MRHLYRGRCEEEHQLRGIRTGIVPKAHFTMAEYSLESKMGKKTRSGDFYQMRNGLSTNTLGDKIYRAPQYSSGFFKEGGLITGSSIAYRPRVCALKNEVDFTENKNAKWPLFPRTLWKDRLKQEEEDKIKNDMDELEKWEETVLKEHRGENEEEEVKDTKQKEKKGGKKSARRR